MDYKEVVNQLRYGRCGADEIAAAADAIETLLAERETAGWISVEDRLPKAKQRVLTYSPVDGIGLGMHIGDGRWIIAANYPDTPTHWMTLPTPPDPK